MVAYSSYLPKLGSYDKQVLSWEGGAAHDGLYVFHNLAATSEDAEIVHFNLMTPPYDDTPTTIYVRNLDTGDDKNGSS